jgi:hypothetical protein
MRWDDVAYQIRAVAEKHVSRIKDHCKNNIVLPCDIHNGSVFQWLPRLLSIHRHLTILLRTDGTPIAKVGGRSLWLIPATIVEIPPLLDSHSSSVIVFSAWLGAGHLNWDLLWANVMMQFRVSQQLVILPRIIFLPNIKCLNFLSCQGTAQE